MACEYELILISIINTVSVAFIDWVQEQNKTRYTHLDEENVKQATIILVFLYDIFFLTFVQSV